MTTSTKLSNVIGAPFSDYVLRQLYLRAVHNSTLSRTDEEVLFLANKTAWARVVSSINITRKGEDLQKYYSDKLKIDQAEVTYPTSDSLAKNWILQAGTSTQNGNGVTLRQGIGPNGAYGLGGTEELGYRPMPGLTSITVETVGRLGSLRQATINFKVWNINQLNVVEALYFRLGYSILLEWGHTQYFTNDNVFQRTGIYGIGDPFVAGLRKEAIQQAIGKKARQTSGNYDGMLGIVSNFNWSFNQDGGYDCTLRLIGLGAVMDSLRINQVFRLPEGTLKEFKKNESVLERAEAALRAANAARAEAQRLSDEAKANAGKPVLRNPPTNLTELVELARDVDFYQGNVEEFTKNYGYYPSSNPSPNYTVFPDFYYTSKLADTTAAANNNERYFGLYVRENNPKSWKRYKTNSTFTFDVAEIDKVVNYLIDQGKTETTFFDGFLNFFGLDSDENLRSLFDRAPNSTLTGKPFSALGKFFWLRSSTREVAQASNVNVSGGGTLRTVVPVDPNEAFNEGSFDFSYKDGVSPKEDKTFNFELTFSNSDSAAYSVTRKQVVEALDKWATSGNAQATLKSITPSGTGVDKSLELEATFFIPVENVVSIDGVTTKPVVNLFFTITFNNTYFLLRPGNDINEQPPTQQTVQNSTSVDNSGTLNQGDTTQVESTSGFESALHAMLVTVQTKAQAAALSVSDILDVDITPETKTFFEAGALKGATDATPPVVTSSDGVPFSVLDYGLKGFSSALMADSTIYSQTPTVPFKELCKAFIVKYPQGDIEGSPDMIHSPVYIQLGYLLAFLNNMCLIYDSTQATTAGQASSVEKRPYLYIDFNPETNFCLTSPQQLSVDPFICLIPFNATQENYKSIFPPEMKLESLFDPSTQNVLTKGLNSKGLNFKVNEYQGKTMSILLNIDYLLRLVKEFSGADEEHAVKLQPFLERILFDVNKCLGNTNAFRVSYRDESNTIQIQDDQWVPNLKKSTGSEPTILNRGEYLTRLRTDPIICGQLPVFGTPDIVDSQQKNVRSLAREFQLRTVMNTKLASMIAISAQANTGSVNAKDHSPFSYLNEGFQDRYKPYIENSSEGTPGINNNSSSKVNSTSNDQKAAELFNTHIASVYFDLKVTADRVEPSKNYYIERMSKVKAEDPITSAAPFIPIEVDLTIDGVSGIIMGNAFTIPENRLPLSLRGEDGFAKIGFIVTGLSNIVESNQWLTKIKGQPIKLREDSVLRSAALATATNIVRTPPSSGGSGGNGALNSLKPGDPYPGACPPVYNEKGVKIDGYSGAPQVLSPESVNTTNFTKYYPGYVFKKGTSDIKVTNPLTEAEIIDDTTQNRFLIGKLATPVPFFIIHHTGGRGRAVDVYTTFYCRGLPAQYVIDREGKIHRFMPDGALAYHAGNYNGKSIGVEIVAKDDSDVTEVQVQAATRLAQYLGFRKDQLVGHGEISTRKLASEGKKVVDYVKNLA